MHHFHYNHHLKIMDTRRPVSIIVTIQGKRPHSLGISNLEVNSCVFQTGKPPLCYIGVALTGARSSRTTRALAQPYLSCIVAKMSRFMLTS